MDGIELLMSPGFYGSVIVSDPLVPTAPDANAIGPSNGAIAIYGIKNTNPVEAAP